MAVDCAQAHGGQAQHDSGPGRGQFAHAYQSGT